METGYSGEGHFRRRLFSGEVKSGVWVGFVGLIPNCQRLNRLLKNSEAPTQRLKAPLKTLHLRYA
jgi:hypothetical protein